MPPLWDEESEEEEGEEERLLPFRGVSGNKGVRGEGEKGGIRALFFSFARLKNKRSLRRYR